MGIYDRDYMRDLHRQRSDQGRAHTPHFHHAKPSDSPKAPPDLATIAWQVFVWLCIFMAIAFVMSYIAPHHFRASTKPGAGVGTPVSTPQAAEPSASIPLPRATRPDVEA